MPRTRSVLWVAIVAIILLAPALATSQSRTTTRQRVDDACALYDRGDFAEAIESLEQLLLRERLDDEQRARARVCLASCYVKRGDAPAAEAVFETVIIESTWSCDPLYYPPEICDVYWTVYDRLNLLASLEIEPSTATIKKGNTQPLKAFGVSRVGRRQDYTGRVTWSSSSDATVSVDEHGVATAHARGQTVTITARFEDTEAQATIEVEGGGGISKWWIVAGVGLIGGALAALAGGGGDSGDGDQPAVDPIGAFPEHP